MSLGKNPLLTRQESHSSFNSSRKTRSWVHQYEYGSAAEELQVRMRLRSHPAVVKVLRLWWSTAVKTINGHKSPFFDDPKRGLNMDQYMQVSRKMYKALYAVWDPVDAEEAATEDWERDSAGGAVDSAPPAARPTAGEGRTRVPMRGLARHSPHPLRSLHTVTEPVSARDGGGARGFACSDAKRRTPPLHASAGWGSNMGERVLSGELFMDASTAVATRTHAARFPHLRPVTSPPTAAVFELADTWTYGSSPELYAAFLTDLFNHIAIGTPPDAYFW